MSTSELADLETLLVRVLPDPMGFAERVFHEVVNRLAGVPPDGDQPGVAWSDESGTYQALVERNVLLAAALGACDCWGTDRDCDICSGDGSAGWIEPDRRLYVEYVEPANLRMSTGDEPAATTLNIGHQQRGESQ